MRSPFNREGDEAPALGVADMRLVNGRAFLISDPSGEIFQPTHGAVFEDVRMLSSVRLRVMTSDDGELRPGRGYELLASSAPTPFSSVAVLRPSAGRNESPWRELLVKRRWLGRGLRQDTEVLNTGVECIERDLVMEFATDFAHLFEMKAGQAGAQQGAFEIRDGAVILAGSDSALRVVLRFAPVPDRIDDEAGTVSWTTSTEAGSRSVVSWSAEPVWDGQPAGIMYPLDSPPAQSISLRRLTSWRQSVPRIRSSDARLPLVVSKAFEDLASLRMFDSDHPERPLIAAGAPWFMTLFGRDALLTSWMLLPFVPEVAAGVLAELADLQGVTDDPLSEEQPGKILHELRRRGGADAFVRRGRYYGTVDATPLFVMLAAEAHRWGALSPEELARLAPSVERAVGWLRRRLESSRFGFVDYERSTDTGLANQGWKDSWDGINFADGTVPEAPIALVEVQGYAWAALRAAAGLARHDVLHDVGSEELEREADLLRSRFEEAFWNEAGGYYVTGLDHRGTQIDSLTTNAGHAVWAGIAEQERARRYVDRIMAEDMWTGWGLRTLSTTMAAYDPLSYHNGSVWPHDTALCAAGAARCGRWEVADRILDGALGAALSYEGRPPELFAGIDAVDVAVPVAYPTSCSPQAWASASTLLHLRTILGLEPAPDRQGVILTRDDLPAIGDIDIASITVGGREVRLRVRDGRAEISHLG